MRTTNKRRLAFLCAAALLAALSIFGWLVSGGPEVPIKLSVSRQEVWRPGTAGPFVAFVTNGASFPITLRPPLIQYEDRVGALTTSLGEMWNGENHVIKLEPGASARLPFGMSEDTMRFRVVVECAWDGGIIRRAVGAILRRLPLPSPDGRVTQWLRHNGLLDGECAWEYYHAWEPKDSVEQNRPRADVAEKK